MARDNWDRFMAEIVANPDDDGPRLVCADWLQERGDPRGEFIRVQCELAAGTSTPSHRQALRRREKELFKKHESQWSAEINGLGVRNPIFSRGFIGAVTTTIHIFVQDHELIRALIPLQHLTLTGTRSSDRLAECGSLDQILSLVMPKNSLPASTLCEFVQSPRLSNLQSWTCKYSTFNSDVVRAISSSDSLSNLRVVDFSHSDLNDDRLEPMLVSDKITQLQDVNVGYNSLEGRCFENASAWKSIRRIDMTNNSITAAGADCLAKSDLMKGLELLDLTANWDLTNRGVASLANSQRAKDLVNLRLRSCNIGGPAVQSIVDSPYLGKLTSLDLGGNGLRDRDLLPIVQSDRLEQLTKLLLSHNEISSVGVDSIVESEFFNPQTLLFLRGNKLSPSTIADYRRRFGRSFGQFTS